MVENIEFHVYRDPLWLGYAVYITGVTRDTNKRIAGPLTMRVVEDGEMPDPTVRISDEAAQMLLDSLWRAGLRPNNGESSLAHIEAKDKHLDDMRKIVAAKLKVDL